MAIRRYFALCGATWRYVAMSRNITRCMSLTCLLPLWLRTLFFAVRVELLYPQTHVRCRLVMLLTMNP